VPAGGQQEVTLPRQTGKRAIFTERVDNVMCLKRFAIHPGEKCIIAEDVVTTGICFILRLPRCTSGRLPPLPMGDSPGG